MREARSPDAAGIRFTQHVKLAGAPKWTREELPMDEIARVMNLNAGEPFESRGGNVVIIADTRDGGVWIEASEDGIVDGHTTVVAGVAARRAASSRSISFTRIWFSG